MKIEKAAQKYLELKAEAEETQKKIDALKAILKEAGPGQYGDYVVLLKDVSRETLPLEQVRQMPSLWNKLKEFVKVTEYKQLLVSPVKS